MDNLDEKGFVFLDDRNKPFRCAMLDEKPHLFGWHSKRKIKRWVPLGEVPQTEVKRFPRNLQEWAQSFYFSKEELEEFSKKVV